MAALCVLLAAVASAASTAAIFLWRQRFASLRSPTILASTPGPAALPAASDASSAELALAWRTRIVDQLLEFSQTIQGAGKPEQIYTSLTHYLRKELDLAGLAV